MRLFILLLFMLFQLLALAQNVFRPLKEPYCMNTNLIRENNIRSLTIFVEFEESRIEERSEEEIRFKTLDFDEDGFVVYEIQTGKSIISPIIWDMDEGIELSLFKYNDDKQTIYTYYENERWRMESFFNYDENQNLSELETIFCGETCEKLKFKWRNGKMVKSKVIYLEDEEERTYNEDGKIIEHKSFGDTFTYEYQNSGDTSSYIESWYRKDSLLSVDYVSYLGESKSQMTHFLSLSSSGDQKTEVFANYDEYGNTTDYHFQKINKSSDKEEKGVDRQAMYNVKNEYDERGLLVKQIFYLRDEITQLMEFDKVLHYTYDSRPLEDKLSPGSIEKERSTIQLR